MKAQPSKPAKRCLDCGYILDALPEHRCPECGRDFNPADPASYVTQRRSGVAYLLVASAGVLVMTVPLGHSLAGELGWLRPSRQLDALLHPLLMVGFLIEATILHLSGSALTGAPGEVRYRAAALAAFGVSLTATAGFCLTVLFLYGGKIFRLLDTP